MIIAAEKQKQKNSDMLPHLYEVLANVLREGSHNAITSQDIMSITGISDRRTVNEIIEQLINKHGYCIGANRRGKHRGYYLISNDDELTETLRTYNAQIQSMLNRYRQLQKNYASKDQQEFDV